jgi:hypothetical protein
MFFLQSSPSSLATLAAISQPPEPRLLIAIAALALGLGLLVWARNKPVGEGKFAKLSGVMATVVGIGFLVMHLHEIEQAPLSGVLCMALAIGLLLWSLSSAAVGRRVVRTLAVPALAVGAGLLALAIITVVTGKSLTVEDRDVPAVLREPIWVFGIGVAFLTAGVTALTLSFVGAGKKPGSPQQSKSDDQVLAQSV